MLIFIYVKGGSSFYNCQVCVSQHIQYEKMKKLAIVFSLDSYQLKETKNMARITDINMTSSIQFSDLLEFAGDYCSDHLGRFFQNKYSLAAQEVNKFEIPDKFRARSGKDRIAICVMMNNHILDLKYFGDIFLEWDNEMSIGSISPGQNLDKLNKFINDQRLLAVIKSFKKINDEIVIGRCRGSDFTPLDSAAH